MKGMKKILVYTLITMMSYAGLQMQVNAGVISTQQLAGAVTVDMQRAEINNLLAREDVAKQLTAFGVDSADAMQRVASLSDAEVSEMYHNIQDMPAGQGALGVIALVLVILILLDVAGVTDIFPKI